MRKRGVTSQRLAFHLCCAVLVLMCWLPEAAATPMQTPSSSPSCVATLPGAEVGTYDGYCYETMVVNADAETGSLPLVIGLHWSGSTPDEFREVLVGIRHPVRLVLVQGPNVRRAGFSFYPVDPYYYDMDEAGQRAVQISESERIASLAGELSRRFKSCGRAVIVGASQGGDLSYLAALRHPNVIGMAIPLLATIDPALIPEHPSRRVPIHALHGVDDPIVAIDTARGIAEAARAKGFDIALTEFDETGHDVPDVMKRKIAALIDEHLKSLECTL